MDRSLRTRFEVAGLIIAIAAVGSVGVWRMLQNDQKDSSSQGPGYEFPLHVEEIPRLPHALAPNVVPLDLPPQTSLQAAERAIAHWSHGRDDELTRGGCVERSIGEMRKALEGNAGALGAGVAGWLGQASGDLKLYICGLIVPLLNDLPGVAIIAQDQATLNAHSVMYGEELRGALILLDLL